jgi:hypothetical protein
MYKTLLVIGAVIGPLVGFSSASDGLGTLGVMLGILTMVVAVGALYVGAVLEEKLGTQPHHVQLQVSPPDA